MTRKENKIITDTKEIIQVLNDHYINEVERSCREKPTVKLLNWFQYNRQSLIHHYEDHLIARHITKTVKRPQNSTSSLLVISEEEVKKDTYGIKHRKINWSWYDAS